ncbi:hypothetical protein Vretifemale_8314 [Volvox reticuliferus]|uniref:Uncharacterized protein n=1 Tax=Volvox reticuliferus TaxID=1737510 RepID=A0A8J4CAV5_9CHLO|nr:hypothetical protein Vretifemale_8314 [Volvox reticuliferus]
MYLIMLIAVAMAAELASRATVVVGLDYPIVATLTTLAASRDGGDGASTSDGHCEQAHHALIQQKSRMACFPSALHHQYATFSTAASSPSPPEAPAASAAALVSTSPSNLTPMPPAVRESSVEAAACDADTDTAVLEGLDMESLMRVLLHPLPLGRKINPSLFSGAAAPVVQLGHEALFFDPSHTLTSTMRALHVIQRVLQDDGHVLVVNPNPAMRPLLREAAHLCLNRNVWFWYRDWQPGLLADTNRSMAAVLDPYHCQPNRRLMSVQGLALRNPLCPPGSLEYNLRQSPPRLNDADMKQLEAGRKATSRQRRDRERARDFKQAVEALAAARAREAKLLPAGMQPAVGRGGHSDRLALMVVLDLSYGSDAVREAVERKIPTVSLLNGHSETSHVTFPVYASESHAGFQHFFLEWLLRVVNLPDPRSQKGYQGGTQQQ